SNDPQCRAKAPPLDFNRRYGTGTALRGTPAPISSTPTPHRNLQYLPGNARALSGSCTRRFFFGSVAGIPHGLFELQIRRVKDPRSMGASCGAYEAHVTCF